MEERERTTVSAAPGWYVAALVKAGAHKGKRGAWLNLEPIIAWDICRNMIPGEDYDFYRVRPITIYDCWNIDDHGWALKQPDGLFEIMGESTYENEADVIERLVELAEHRARNTPRADHEPPPNNADAQENLTSLRKSVGRIYGVLKDMERNGAA